MSSFASGSTTRTYEITTSSMSDDKKNPIPRTEQTKPKGPFRRGDEYDMCPTHQIRYSAGATCPLCAHARQFHLEPPVMNGMIESPCQGRCGETIVLPMSLEGAITKCSVCDPDGWVRVERSLSGNWA